MGWGCDCTARRRSDCSATFMSLDSLITCTMCDVMALERIYNEGVIIDGLITSKGKAMNTHPQSYEPICSSRFPSALQLNENKTTWLTSGRARGAAVACFVRQLQQLAADLALHVSRWSRWGFAMHLATKSRECLFDHVSIKALLPVIHLSIKLLLIIEWSNLRQIACNCYTCSGHQSDL